MKRICMTALPTLLVVSVAAQEEMPVVPQIPYVSVANFLKYSPEMNLGEVLGVAVNSKGHIMILNHPGTSTSGPLYGNATTQLLEFDEDGTFVREIGQGVYGLGYAHSVRYDKDDNLWVVDKGTNSVMKFNPDGYVVMNLGRRPEGFEPYEHASAPQARARPGYFAGPTDVAWDPDGNIFISDGYINSRIAKFDQHGNWIKSWGSYGSEVGQLRLPHSMQIDRQGNVYVADRTNRRIQVFDADGNFHRMILLRAWYDTSLPTAFGAGNPNGRPRVSAPWALCISNGPTQYLWVADETPGRIYKITLEGEILGVLGTSGRELGEFNWIHGLAVPSDDVIYVADMNNWRLQKLILNPEGRR